MFRTIVLCSVWITQHTREVRGRSRVSALSAGVPIFKASVEKNSLLAVVDIAEKITEMLMRLFHFIQSSPFFVGHCPRQLALSSFYSSAITNREQGHKTEARSISESRNVCCSLRLTTRRMICNTEGNHTWSWGSPSWSREAHLEEVEVDTIPLEAGLALIGYREALLDGPADFVIITE